MRSVWSQDVDWQGDLDPAQMLFFKELNGGMELMTKFTSHFYSLTTQGCLGQKRSQRTEASQKDLQGWFQKRVIIVIIGYITSFLINSFNSFEEGGQVPLNIPSNHHFHCHGLWNKRMLLTSYDI